MNKDEVIRIRRAFDDVGRPYKELTQKLHPLFESLKEARKFESVAADSLKSHFVVPDYDDNDEGMKPKQDLDREEENKKLDSEVS